MLASKQPSLFKKANWKSENSSLSIILLAKILCMVRAKTEVIDIGLNSSGHVGISPLGMNATLAADRDEGRASTASITLRSPAMEP